MFFIVVLVFVILVPCTTAKPGDYEYKIVNYVALGDSIAGGYGLEDVPKESYVGRVAAALEDRYGAVRLKNFGKMVSAAMSFWRFLRRRTTGSMLLMWRQYKKQILLLFLSVPMTFCNTCPGM